MLLSMPKVLCHFSYLTGESLSLTHTHTHTYIYISLFIYRFEPTEEEIREIRKGERRQKRLKIYDLDWSQVKG